MSKHLYRLEKGKPKKFTEVELWGASVHEFPILKGQRGALYSVKLDVDGVREPHWPPNAWEFDYCISGLGRMTVLAPQGEVDTFEVNPGDLNDYSLLRRRSEILRKIFHNYRDP